MKNFDSKFKEDLYQIISEIENGSMVEVVTIIRDNRDRYKDVALLWAALLTGAIYTIMMIIPIYIDVYIMFVLNILNFVFLFFLIKNVRGLLRFFASAKRKEKEIDIMSRAIFQKGGLRFTEEKIGVLFFVSYLEKKVTILPDRGAKLAIPELEWDSMQKKFNDTFSDTNPAMSILYALKDAGKTFSSYIKPVENDINELPDNLDIDF